MPHFLEETDQKWFGCSDMRLSRSLSQPKNIIKKNFKKINLKHITTKIINKNTTNKKSRPHDSIRANQNYQLKTIVDCPQRAKARSQT